MNSLGERILYLRKKNNLTQKELADLIKTARSSIGKIENNEVSPSVEVIIELSKVFKVSTDWLLTGNEYDSTNVLLKYTDEQVIKIIKNASYEDRNIIFGFLSKFENNNNKK